MCMCVYVSVYMYVYVHHVHADALKGQREGHQNPWNRQLWAFQYWWWDLNPGLLQVQQVILTVKPSLPHLKSRLDF